MTSNKELVLSAIKVGLSDVQDVAEATGLTVKQVKAAVRNLDSQDNLNIGFTKVTKSYIYLRT